MKLSDINGYKNVAMDGYLDMSIDAKELGLKRFCASGLKSFEKKLEGTMWQLVDRESVGLGALTINLKETKKQEKLKVSLPLPDGFRLPFIGPVQQKGQDSENKEKEKDLSTYVFGSFFGMDFSMKNLPNDVQQHEVVVPAWASRSVTKANQAFFEKTSFTVFIVVYMPSILSESGDGEEYGDSLAELRVVLPPGHLHRSEEEAAAWAAESGFSRMRSWTVNFGILELDSRTDI